MAYSVRDLDEALVRANRSDFGLVSYIWSDDLRSVMRAPFGGFTQSDIGGEGLPGSIELFTEQKTTMIPQEPVTLPRLGIGLSVTGA